MLGFIRRTISISEHYLPTLRSLYTVLVRSYLDCASEIWSPKSVFMIKPVEGVQRRETRVLLPELSYNERLERLDLLPLLYQRECRDLVIFYKVKYGHYNCSFDSYFQFCSDKRLGSFSSNKLRLNLVKSELFKPTFLNIIPCLWKNLPDNLRTEDLSLSCFKKGCRNFL